MTPTVSCYTNVEGPRIQGGPLVLRACLLEAVQFADWSLALCPRPPSMTRGRPTSLDSVEALAACIPPGMYPGYEHIETHFEVQL